MTIVGIHPEDLFDKLIDGALTPVENERLNAHLAVCDVCRFEYAARSDFRDEALEVARLAPPPALPLRPGSQPSLQRVPTPAGRRRSRWVVWGLAAAVLIPASGALAAVGFSGNAPWAAAVPLFVPSAKATERLAPIGVKRSVARRIADEAAAGRAASMPTSAATLPPGSTVSASRDDEASPLEESGPIAALSRGAVRATRVAARQSQPTARNDGPSVNSQESVSGPAKEPLTAAKEPAKEPLTAAKEPAKEPLTAAKLFGDANQARRGGDLASALNLYRLLQGQFPASSEAELSRVTLALLLLDSGDAQGALTGFDRYLAGPSRGLEAEALVGRARALGRLGRRELEIAAWREVRRKYGRSVYGRQASERLASLGQP